MAPFLGQCTVGLVPLSVWCAGNEHDAVLHQGLGTEQFVVGCIVDNINYPCLARTTLQAPEEVPHIQPQGLVLPVASLPTDCVYAVGVNLGVSGVSQLILLLLVVGLSLAPSVAALVPVVPRDANHSVLARKSCLYSFVYSCLLCHRLIDHKCVALFLGSLCCSIDLHVCFCASIILF